MLNPNRYTNNVIPTSAEQHRLNKVIAAKTVWQDKLINRSEMSLFDRMSTQKIIDGLDAQIVELTTLTNKL